VVLDDFRGSHGGKNFLAHIFCQDSATQKALTTTWPGIEADGSVETSTPSNMAT